MSDADFTWLGGYGLKAGEIGRLLPTLAGGLTSATSFYVNSMLPNHVFRGAEQASIPMTEGRWYLVPLELVKDHPRLTEKPLPLAAARSLLPPPSTGSISAWTTGG